MIVAFKMIRGIDREVFYIDEDRTRNNNLCLNIRSNVNSNIGLTFFHFES